MSDLVPNEAHIKEVVDGAVRKVWNEVWGDRELTRIQKRLAWALVIGALVDSLMLELQTEMLREAIDTDNHVENKTV